MKRNMINDAFVNAMFSKGKAYHAYYQTEQGYFKTPSYSYDVLLMYIDEIREHHIIHEIHFVEG